MEMEAVTGLNGMVEVVRRSLRLNRRVARVLKASVTEFDDEENAMLDLTSTGAALLPPRN